MYNVFANFFDNDCYNQLYAMNHYTTMFDII